MRKGLQREFCCRCGREKIRANGHCATCYTLRQHDARYFGGLRELALERDGRCCRLCGASGRDKRPSSCTTVLQEKSTLKLLVSLCPACHARIHHTKVVFSDMPPLLLELWREQHPEGHEQTRLDFRDLKAQAVPVRLFI